MRVSTLTHTFVDYIPETLEDGVLYVCIPFATVVHKCCCGCGSEVVTPLSPIDWQLTFDGESISLTPSIGNWGFRCQSHYWIRHNEVTWARRWSRHQIEDARSKDRRSTQRYFANRGLVSPTDVGSNGSVQEGANRLSKLIHRIRSWLSQIRG